MRRLIRAVLCAAVIAVACACMASSAFAYGALGWGDNEEGQLGNNFVSSSPTAVTVGNLNVAVTALATAGGHSLGLVNGRVYAWGNNSWGQDGTGGTSNHQLPVSTGLEGVEAIATGNDFSIALLKTGVVKAWGRNSFGELGIGEKNGPEWCGLTTEHPTEAEKEEHACSTNPRTVTGVEATAISAGTCHALALLKSGKVDAWGCNQTGQLGDGTSTGPQECDGSAKVPCSTSPVAVGELSGAKGVAAGGSFSLALVGPGESGEAYGWGLNASGQLGVGSTTGPEKCMTIFSEVGCSKSPVKVHVLKEASAIAAGESHALALEKGKLLAWGSNSAGELGLGSTEGKTEPTEVSGVEPTAIAAGGEQSAVVSGGVVKEAGANGWGQLGDGTTTNRTTFTSVLTGELHGVATGGKQTLVWGTPGTAVSSLEPSTGASKGGYWVTIKGEHLAGPKEVLFGTTPATEIEYISETEIRAKAPLGKPGTRNVVVKAERSISAATSAAKFTYEPGGSVEFGHCSKVGTKGKYKTASCTEEVAEGAWEWVKGVTKGGFTASLLAETSVTFESVTAAKLTCEGMTASGEFSKTRSVGGVVMHFTGCKYEGSSCSTAGAASGEVVTTTLEGGVGFVEKASNNLGIQLAPASGETWFTATCGENSIAIKGGVIGVFNPANKTTSSFTLRFKQTAGKQKITEFEEEGAPKESLKMSINGSFIWLTAGLGMESQTSNEEPLEANTVV